MAMGEGSSRGRGGQLRSMWREDGRGEVGEKRVHDACLLWCCITKSLRRGWWESIAHPSSRSPSERARQQGRSRRLWRHPACTAETLDVHPRRARRPSPMAHPQKTRLMQSRQLGRQIFALTGPSLTPCMPHATLSGPRRAIRPLLRSWCFACDLDFLLAPTLPVPARHHPPSPAPHFSKPRPRPAVNFRRGPGRRQSVCV
jgi:hypothetical protein